jgi:outer membrane protein TolC
LNLGPNEAVKLAIDNNLSLRTAMIDLDNKQRRNDLVWNQFLPNVTVMGRLNRSNWPSTTSATIPVPGTGMPFTFDGISGRLNPHFFITDPIDIPRWNVTGILSASLDFSFALVAGIEAIRSDYRAGLVSLERAKLQMERDIRKTYNQILLLENTVALQRNGFANAERQAAIAEANFQAGLAPRLTWLQAQVQVENLKPGITDMENSLSALKANFAITLGLPFDTVIHLEEIPVEGFSIPLDLSELITQASSGRPEIMELQSNIITLQNQRKAMALQLYTPFLRFSWDLAQAFTKDPWRDSWFNSDDWRGGGNFTITLGMSLNNIFPFTQENQRLQDMDNTISNLNIRLAQAIQGTELEIFTKVNSLHKTQTSMEVQQAAVELAELSYNLTEEAYRAGLQDFQSVQNSALALSQSRLQLLSQQFNYINDLIDLEYAIGVPFGTLSSLF